MRHRKQLSTGVELDVFDKGKGDAVLYLHGFLDFSAKDAFVDPIASGHRLIAPTHPGYGDAPVPAWLDSVTDAAFIYWSLLDELGIDRFHLVGGALGGWIAAEMATMAPERVKSMTLVSPVGVKLGARDALDIPDLYKYPHDELYRAFFSDNADVTFDPDSLSDEEIVAFIRSREAVALYAWEPWMHNPKLRHRLSRASVDTILARGAEDKIVAKWYADGFAELLPNATRTEIDGAGHDLLHDAPGELAKLVMKQIGAQ
ncbi:Pimeloyl-ACP methyl ester carboxylesterase [Lutimaribacter pacificus]|uniref:Pimeloyl-ACP methyl ester carboxylesterase n=1 Tax=Lutimaribacter pacificus TaxID=391948 RepID=A0A1H0M2P0_9RHOB|nr:alpha/beta hydrolase [Lutimaribacter pacificus]SDO74673.1 Pimeloyl-ACP methyl ester carboxylesterase [Lutimaribacter pacificus]SHK77076.1 Pimeloyl-ACP methyl ester carboxylesterase [Lutimaribacter pacificus]